MNHIVQMLCLAFAGILLLWFGYFLIFFAVPQGGSFPAFRSKNRSKTQAQGIPGAPRTCPVCAAMLEKGERVKSAVFPSSGGHEKTMHISGCAYCLVEGGRERKCPVCGAVLHENGYLIARLFEKPGRSHVHVSGCSRCQMEKF